jgi:hypothetical protein
MTFHKTKRAVTTLAVMTSWSVLCIASPSAAQAEDSEAGAAGEEGASKEGEGEEKKRLNSVRLSGVYAFHVLEHRDSATTGEPLHTRESLGGFEISYERELIEEHLSLEIAKPFVFSPDSWETPFDLTLKGLFVKGPWEGYIGAMITWNIRIFNKERAEFEGQENVLSFGVGGTIGGSYHFTERWALELGIDYEYVPTDPVVTHGIDFALGGVYHF